jgi:hypothetical protein
MCYDKQRFQRRADDKDRAHQEAEAAKEPRPRRPTDAPAPSEQRMPATTPVTEAESD